MRGEDTGRVNPKGSLETKHTPERHKPIDERGRDIKGNMVKKVGPDIVSLPTSDKGTYRS